MRDAGGRVTLTMGAVLILLVTGGLLGGPRGAAAAGGESAFVGLPPCRLVDTRGNGFGGAFGPPALATGVPRDFPLQGQCGIPASALAVSLNVTATSTQGPGFLLLFPQGGVLPLVSTLNYVAGQTVANAALVPLGPGGLTVAAGVSGTDLILDVDGYFTDSLVHAVDLNNLFVGAQAGNLATTAPDNTAVGFRALAANTTGNGNSAVGAFALERNTTGGSNVAMGLGALLANTIGNSNTALGLNALATSTGDSNTAVGQATLVALSSGDSNTAVGNFALGQLGSGHDNIALGPFAGYDLVSGNNNIYVGHHGDIENRTIRLGDVQIHTFIAGIRGRTTAVADAIPVLIDSTGQLGTMNSSRRVKTDIEDIGERSRGLHALRPVSFRYRVHPPGGPLEYGLIAEEVAEVYPELVVRDADGAPETVRYHLLPALLLNELQRVVAEKDRQLAELTAEVRAERTQRIELAAALAELAAEVARLKERRPAGAQLSREDR